MDPIERRRNQNRMAQRRFRSKKASESVKKTPSDTASSTTNDTATTGSTAFVQYSAANGNAQTHTNPTTTALSHGPNVVPKSAEDSDSPASTDLLTSLSANVQEMLLPDSRNGFSPATCSLMGFSHQEPDQNISLPLPPRASIAQGTPLIEPDNFSYISPCLSDKLRDPSQLRPDTDMHVNLTLTSPPDEAFYGQPSGPDSGPNFSLTSDQLTPSSLYDSSETGSIRVKATCYQIAFCQNCSALGMRSTPHISTRDVLRRPHIMPNGDKESISGTRCDGGNGTDNSSEADFESSLHIAAESGHSDLVDMLLRSGSIVNEPDSGGNTPLHRATNKRDIPVVQMLLQHGADPNLMNTAGRTPVHIAVSIGSMEIVETLVRFGGDLNRRARRKSSRIDSKHGDSNQT